MAEKEHVHTITSIENINPTSSIDSRVDKRKKINLFLLISSIGLGIFMAALDESIINVSIAQIKVDLNEDPLRIQWIVLVYLLVIVALSAASGYLGDRYSTKIVFQIGMGIFAIGSLLCAISQTLPMLIFARIVQGIGGAGILANGNAIVTRFTDESRRGLAIGLTSLVSALAVVIGPVVGAMLTQFFKWQVVFWINLPIGILGILYIQFSIPKTPSLRRENKRADFLGSILFATFLTILVLSISLFVDPVLPHPMIWSIVCLGISIALFVGFILWEKRSSSPFMELSLFKNKKFTIGLACALILYISLNSISYQLPFYFKEVMSYELIKIGIVIVGVPVGIGISAPISGKLSSKINTRVISSFGLGTISITFIFLAIFLSPTMHLAIYVLLSFIIGLGVGLFISPNSNSVMSSIKKDKLGVASSLLSLSRIVGYTIGTALSTTVLRFIQELYQQRNGGMINDSINYTPSLQIVFGVFCFFASLSVILSIVRGSEKYIKNGFVKIDSSEIETKTLDISGSSK
ncbi:MAG: MFS transporter [Candidatus Heimdallarchaeota archaeon]|nr:MFS transporter [Candidatus Heimdallarchaeota archaeon]